MTLFPMAVFDAITEEQCNEKLIAWKHKKGPLERVEFTLQVFHGLYLFGELEAVTATSQTIAPVIAGCPELNRENTVELSRLCASRSGLCRVALRLWREVVFPTIGRPNAVSYQDADQQNGNTYRFDGWQRRSFSHSGTDARSGRKGCNKWVWVWPPNPAFKMECDDRRRAK